MIQLRDRPPALYHYPAAEWPRPERLRALGQILLPGDAGRAEALREIRRQTGRVTVDTEYHLPEGQKRHRARLRLVQLAVLIDGQPVAVVAEPAEILDLLAEVLPDRRRLKVFHNAKDDIIVVEANTGIKTRRVHCTQLLSQVCWAGITYVRGGDVDGVRVEAGLFRHSLKAVGARLGIPIEKELQSSDWSGDISTEQALYGGNDAWVLHPVHDILVAFVENPALAWSDPSVVENITYVAGAECAAAPVFAQAQLKGMPVNRDVLENALRQWDRGRELLYAPFRAQFPGVEPSQKQAVAFALSKALGVQFYVERDPKPIKCKTCNGTGDVAPKKGWQLGWVTDELSRWVAEGHPITKGPRVPCQACGTSGKIPGKTPISTSVGVDALAHYTIEYREWEASRKPDRNYPNFGVPIDPAKRPIHEAISSFLSGNSGATQESLLKGLLEHLEPDGCVHTSFFQIAGGWNDEAGQGQGRSSSKDPNLQNLPHLRPRHAALCVPCGKFFPGAKRCPICKGPVGLPHPRSPFVAPPGYKFQIADLAAAHMRIAAQASGDKVLCDAFRTGKDPHILTALELCRYEGRQWDYDHFKALVKAAKAGSVDVDALLAVAKRKNGKIANYGFQNGQGVMTCISSAEQNAEPTYLTFDDGTLAKKAWGKTFRRLSQFLHEQAAAANRYNIRFPWDDKTYGMARALDGGILYMPKGDWGGVKFTEAVAMCWMRSEKTVLDYAGAEHLQWCDEHPDADASIRNLVHDELNGLSLEGEPALAAAHSMGTAMQRSFERVLRTADGGIPAVEPGGWKPGDLIATCWAEKV